MDIELGVALLPHITTQQLITNICPANYNNKPHLSLYQFKVNVDEIGLVINCVDDLFKQQVIFDIVFKSYSELVGSNVFWNAINSEQLYELHIKIIESQLRHYAKTLRLYQVEDYLSSGGRLSVEEQALFERFGIWWVKNQFSPHITLLYNVDSNPCDNLLLPTKIQFDTVAIVQLGYHGNAVRILWEKELILQPI